MNQYATGGRSWNFSIAVGGAVKASSKKGTATILGFSEKVNFRVHRPDGSHPMAVQVVLAERWGRSDAEVWTCLATLLAT
jgi:hypothetical protein